MSELPGRFTRAEAVAGWPEPQELGAQLAHAAATGEGVKDEPGTLLLRAPAPGGGAAWWKLYRVAGARQLPAAFTRSRGLREWRALCALQAAGLPVAAPLAFGEQRSAGRLRCSLLVTGAVEGACDLRAVLARPDLAAEEREAWMAAAGRAVRRLHDAGFAHFRMQLRNLLARGAGADREVLFLDAPYACAFPKEAPPGARRLDLVDLAGALSSASVEDARVLLDAYAGAAQPPLDLRTLRTRPRLPQKLRRIGRYLLYTHTGHRPAPAA